MIFFPLFISLLSILLYLVAFSPFVLAQEVATIRKVPGLQEPVEILRDRWGISYIYAKNHKPLKSFWYLLKRAAKSNKESAEYHKLLILNFPSEAQVSSYAYHIALRSRALYCLPFAFRRI